LKTCQQCPTCYASTPELREHAPRDCPGHLDTGELLRRHEYTTGLERRLIRAHRVAALLAGLFAGSLIALAANCFALMMTFPQVGR